MTDILDDELEFQEDMDKLRRLQEEIFWKHSSLDVVTAKHAWDDIDVYGDQPILVGTLFDRELGKLDESYQ